MYNTFLPPLLLLVSVLDQINTSGDVMTFDDLVVCP